MHMCLCCLQFLAALLLAGPRASPCAVQAQQMQQPVPFQFEIPGDLQLIDQRQLGIFHYPLSGFVSVTADTKYGCLTMHIT